MTRYHEMNEIMPLVVHGVHECRKQLSSFCISAFTITNVCVLLQLKLGTNNFVVAFYKAFVSYKCNIDATLNIELIIFCHGRTQTFWFRNLLFYIRSPYKHWTYIHRLYLYQYGSNLVILRKTVWSCACVLFHAAQHDIIPTNK